MSPKRYNDCYNKVHEVKKPFAHWFFFISLYCAIFELQSNSKKWIIYNIEMNSKLKYLLLSFFSFIAGLTINAQMIVGTDTLYGNEWIRYDQSYYKISVGADGIYRLSYQSLSDAGVPVSSIAAEHFQLFYLGDRKSVV